MSRILTVCLTVAFCFCFSITAYAAGDPLTVGNNLSTFIFGFILAGGIVVTFAKEIRDLIIG